MSGDRKHGYEYSCSIRGGEFLQEGSFGLCSMKLKSVRQLVMLPWSKLYTYNRNLNIKQYIHK